MSTAEERVMLLRRVLEESKVSGAQLARDAGLSEDALWSWIGGRRNPSGESLRKLAAGLRRRSELFEGLADQLDRAAGEG